MSSENTHWCPDLPELPDTITAVASIGTDVRCEATFFLEKKVSKKTDGAPAYVCDKLKLRVDAKLVVRQPDRTTEEPYTAPGYMEMQWHSEMLSSWYRQPSDACSWALKNFLAQAFKDVVPDYRIEAGTK